MNTYYSSFSKPVRTLAMLIALALPLAIHGAEIVLVEDGKAQSVIITPTKTHPLQALLWRISWSLSKAPPVPAEGKPWSTAAIGLLRELHDAPLQSLRW